MDNDPTHTSPRPHEGASARDESERRTLEGDLNGLRDTAAEATREARELFKAGVDVSPLGAVAAAVCVGLALGGVLPRPALGVLMGIGSRVIGKYVGDELTEAFGLDQAGSDGPRANGASVRRK